MKEIIEACRRGDRRAQTELYDRFAPGVYNSCLRILGDRAAAEDAMQDSFIKAFGRLPDDIPLEAWLRRVAINTSIDVLRRRKMVFTSLNENLPDEEPEHEEDVKASVAAIREGMQRLPEGYRLVLTLHLVEGYSFDEAAEALGITPSTVRSQYVRGKARLREILKKL